MYQLHQQYPSASIKHFQTTPIDHISLPAKQKKNESYRTQPPIVNVVRRPCPASFHTKVVDTRIAPIRMQRNDSDITSKNIRAGSFKTACVSPPGNFKIHEENLKSSSSTQTLKFPTQNKMPFLDVQALRKWMASEKNGKKKKKKVHCIAHRNAQLTMKNRAIAAASHHAVRDQLDHHQQQLLLPPQHQNQEQQLPFPLQQHLSLQQHVQVKQDKKRTPGQHHVNLKHDKLRHDARSNIGEVDISTDFILSSFLGHTFREDNTKAPMEGPATTGVVTPRKDDNIDMFQNLLKSDSTDDFSLSDADIEALSGAYSDDIIMPDIMGLSYTKNTVSYPSLPAMQIVPRLVSVGKQNVADLYTHMH
mmetsp:Transcript_9888/g.12141  ORF Transcript_9888/g.12141 Transcript_9888/m.12141 type:complete len:362 (+) Transcript_9888:1-1086(+)